MTTILKSDNFVSLPSNSNGMHTLGFTTENPDDLKLLASLADRLGVKSIDIRNAEIIELLQEEELRLELALYLFQSNRISMGKASALSGLHQFDFQKILAGRKIPIHYDTEDFKDDIKTLNESESGYH
ncbi:MAG: UPF0175 family protein [Bacteroidales bacterium]